MHQPLGGAQGQVTEMMIQINEHMRLKEYLNNVLVRHTGQDKATIERDTDRDTFLTAQQAVEYGLIDNILAREKLLVPPMTVPLPSATLATR